ncbi:hypothetical protein Taro_041880 [Colocasia esculenta]|uniref:BZIP domain-containing protein n=1 Tax=Colocasia esculenta TaxID=4460 RepID=A0A843WCK0_COLES|nr:hypothetical protein [Colocasia esculenta]
MAHLPPKAPTIPSNWPHSGGFDHQRPPTMATFFPASPAAAAQPSWVEEFFDFSSARRGVLRRSASDAVTFLEAPLIAAIEEDCRRNGGGGGALEFERLDDDQLMSMFSDEAAPPALASASNPSTTSSDNSSANYEEKAAAAAAMAAAAMATATVASELRSQEANSEAEQEEPPAAPQSPPREAVMDPKRVKRILANRQSAQRSRVRKLQYVSDLERSVTSLQNEVSALSPRVAFLDHQRSLLTVGNSALKQRIAALAQDKIFKDAHQEALRKEIERLRQVYQLHQNMKKVASREGAATIPSPTSEPVSAGTDKGLRS